MTSTTTETTTTDSDGGPPPADPTFVDKRDRLAERLQELRRRLDAPSDNQDVFELDLYSYDESLVVAADLLDVEVPKGARGEMSADHRAILEERLAAAGIDVRSEPTPQLGTAPLDLLE